MPRISEKRQLENEIASTIEAVTLAMLLESDSESEEVEGGYEDLLGTLALAYIPRSIRLTIPQPRHSRLRRPAAYFSIFVYLSRTFFAVICPLSGEYVLLHFVNPICWPASQTLVVFLHPSDQLFEFSGLPRAHRVGSRKQAWWRQPEVVGNVVMVLSAVGDAAKA